MTESSPPPATVPEQEPGRDIVVTPMPPGSWQLLLGVLLAALAPLGGFLFGSMVGPGSTEADFSPLVLYLFGGFVLGGCGIILAVVGGRRLFRHLRPRT